MSRVPYDHQWHPQYQKGFNVTDPGALGPDYTEGQDLLQQFYSCSDKIQYLNNTLVWGIFHDRSLALARNGTSSSLRFKHLVVATGAYDRPVPFPGWTLPGVFTTGGAQKLVKTERVLPGENSLLAGTGPLQLVLADQILKAGGKIAAILEAGNFANHWLQGLKGIWGNWNFLKEGMQYWRNIKKAGVPLLPNHMIIEARGDGRVQKVVIAKVDKNWRPEPNNAQSVSVDSICLGYGLVSSADLTMLAECEHEYDLRRGGYIPLRKANMEMDFEYVQGGGLLIIEDQNQLPFVEAHLQKRADDGYPLEMIDAQQVLELEPHLAEERVVGAVYSPIDGNTNPIFLVIALNLQAQKSGAQLFHYTEVLDIEVTGGQVQGVVTDKGTITTNTVVNAAGSWGCSIGDMVGIKVPVAPFQLAMLVTEQLPPTLSHAIMGASYMAEEDTGKAAELGCGLIMSQQRAGNLLIGASWR